jgi:superfamily II DNA helicase RecQ
MNFPVYDNDVITVLPTGYGKSLIFEILPYFTKYVTGKSSIVILIAPLKAIINQESENLRPNQEYNGPHLPLHR